MRKFVVATVALFLATSAFAGKPFLRVGAGFDRGGDTTVRDRDCASTVPPALFGCVEGNDGRSLAARGDFGRSAAFDLGAGIELSRATRVELDIVHDGGLELDAEANFPGVTGEQPVDARLRSTAMLAVVTRSFGRHFFVAGGAGAARNSIATTRYAFPGIGANAVTLMPGGTRSGFAWSAAAGVTWPLTERLDLDVALRVIDRGEVRSDGGPATIIRPTRTLTLDIAGTKAALRTSGVSVSVRWRL